jgi:thioesterase domain-containing protein
MPAKPGNNQHRATERPIHPARASPSQLAFDHRDALRQSLIVIDATALRDAEQYFHQQIPITRAMGVRIVSRDESQFVVEAPVALNSNHLGTAFGGSINAVATLAAYGLLWLELNDPSVHVVVAESTIRFLRPVREKIRATCQRPDPNEWNVFRAKFESAGKAPITLRVHVLDGEQTAAEFEGTFVARSHMA